MDRVSIETVRTQSAFEALSPDWNGLVTAMPRPSPFLLHAWLAETWRHYGSGHELAIHVARREGRLVGALPLWTRRRGPLRVSEFLGGERFPPADVLLAAGETPDVARVLADHAARTHDFADLFGLPGSSTLGRTLRLVERLESPVLDLRPGWDAIYRAKVSGKHRYRDRAKRRRLSELGDLSVVVSRTPDELQKALEQAFVVHERRWGGPERSDFAGEPGSAFHRDVTRALAGDGHPLIVALELDGRMLAFSYCLLIARRFYLYRIGFDPEWSAYSVGYLNNLDANEAACAEGAEVFEFLGGAEEPKVLLGDGFAPLYEGIGLAGSTAGRAAAATRSAYVSTRGRLRRSPRVHGWVRAARDTAARVRGGAAGRR